MIQEATFSLSGDFRRAVVGLLYSPSEHCARTLHQAMKGMGTDEKTLNIVIMTTKSQVGKVKNLVHYYMGISGEKHCVCHGHSDLTNVIFMLLLLTLYNVSPIPIQVPI